MPLVVAAIVHATCTSGYIVMKSLQRGKVGVFLYLRVQQEIFLLGHLLELQAEFG